MEIKQNKEHLKFGLVGKNIDYSFSRGYFTQKFNDNNLPYSYVNFDLQNITEFESVINTCKNLKGLNVTIPYKETIIPYLGKLNKRAKEIGAVNTIKVSKKGKLIGYNTDYYGFEQSLKPHLKKYHNKALILGTGGASKAVAYALKKLKIDYNFVSRTKQSGVNLSYLDLDEAIIAAHQIIINCTPIGTFPKSQDCPDIPYNGITKNHILYDLIYNPAETKFLSLGKLKNATTINGAKMLKLQAEKSWEIWNSSKR